MAIQKLQNFGLLIAYNQHMLPYDQRDSSETLHRNCRMPRLIHRRKLHRLQFAFVLKDKFYLLDNREIPTRRRVGVLFLLDKINHYKFHKNPQYRCMLEWNNLPAEMSLIVNKEAFKSAVIGTIPNPYVKVL